MAHCSIPNSTPANGRISTRSLRQSRKQNSAATAFFAALSLTKAIETQTLSLFNAQRPTPNTQRSIQTIRRWMLGVGRWAFSASGRVKGAWWPSRSSKPSSSRKWRGRFDSYPLRLDFSTPKAQRSTLHIQLKQLDVGRWTLSVGRFLFSQLERR